MIGWTRSNARSPKFDPRPRNSAIASATRSAHGPLNGPPQRRSAGQVPQHLARRRTQRITQELKQPSMTRDQLFARWRARRDEWRRLGVRVEGAAICDEILADFQAVFTSEGEQPLTLTEASRMSAYSPDHLGRLLRNGTIPNAGRPNAPNPHRRSAAQTARPSSESSDMSAFCSAEVHAVHKGRPTKPSRNRRTFCRPTA